MALPSERLAELLAKLPETGTSQETNQLGEILAQEFAMVFRLPSVAKYACYTEQGEIVFQVRLNKDDLKSFASFLADLEEGEEREDNESLIEAIKEEGRRLFEEIYGDLSR